MTANTTRRPVPMAGTGDGPRPDSTSFAPTARTDGGRRADERRADSRPDRRSTDERRAASNRTAADDSTL
ncbi:MULTISPECIES: hypothetical protein [Halorubrum]|uniref:Uncharacterized protein n=1 Tax=Halorubrum ruber TaxID=2982524 RepID=A0A8T8LQB6_9EURY|nr:MULTISPECIES: hypothetical protein [Halorubrum]QUO49015.1 hypothetical protein J7656_06695 [Halorubrum ruber]